MRKIVVSSSAEISTSREQANEGSASRPWLESRWHMRGTTQKRLNGALKQKMGK
jgi:hypothetical protein